MANELSKEQRETYLDRVRDILIAMMMGEVEDRVDDIEKLLRDHPTEAEVYYLLGLAAWRMDDAGRAMQWLNKAHEIDSQCREYADALAVIYTRNGRLHDGLYFAKLATVLEPHPDIQPLLPMDLSNYFVALAQTKPSRHYVDAVVQFNRRRWNATINECEKELRINTAHGPCYGLLGRACIHAGDYEKARDALKAATYLEKTVAIHQVNLGDALMHLGETADALEAFKAALAMAPDDVTVAARARLAADYLDDDADSDAFRKSLDAELQSRAERARKQADADLGEEEDVPAGPRNPGERIGVAILSNDLCESRAARQLEPILQRYDRSRMQMRIYQQSVLEDATNSHLKVMADNARRIYDIDDEIMSIIVKGDQIDVLVDSAGFTEDARPKLVALHAAPVQVGWLSPPAGIGAPGIDVILADEATIDADRAGLADGQRIVKMTHGLHAYAPFDLLPDPSPLPMQANGFVTFGGIADARHVTPGCVSLWKSALDSAPNSRLLLGNIFAVPQMTRDALHAAFDKAGLGDRIAFHDSRAELRRDPTFYQAIDIYLDSTPVNGAQEAAEALWMGVPVVTLKGKRRSGVIGASILTAAGETDWIATDSASYAKIVKSLTADAGELGKLRQSLRTGVKARKLFDVAGFARSFSTAIERAMSGAAD